MQSGVKDDTRTGESTMALAQSKVKFSALRSEGKEGRGQSTEREGNICFLVEIIVHHQSVRVVLIII
jgi:hypothetical protein